MLILNHLDEMTCLVFLDRQVDGVRAQEICAHSEGCVACHTLLHALERESRLLTRAMLQEDEPLPACLEGFHWQQHLKQVGVGRLETNREPRTRRKQ